MPDQSALTLINPQTGNPAFRIFSFDDSSFFDQLKRNNFFTLIWVINWSGKVNANFNE